MVRLCVDKRRDARKRKKHRELDCAAGSGTADAAEMEADESILAQPEQEKPEKPKPFDQDEELKKVR